MLMPTLIPADLDVSSQTGTAGMVRRAGNGICFMSKSILSVDDSATLRRMVSFTLKSAGYDVLEAGDGAEALQLLKGRPVDLVISDVNMPNMDGLELTRQLRRQPGFGRTPIILLTTESDPGKKAEGRAAGATGWIVKPFNQEQLLAIVAKVVPN